MLIESILAELVRDFFGLDDDRVWIADQNRIIPKDTGLFACVKMLWCNAKSNAQTFDASTKKVLQSVVMTGQAQIDIFSRDNSALQQYPFLIAMLRSPEALESMQINSYQIAQIPSEVSNVSSVVGSEEYYHYTIRFTCNWVVNKTESVNYYDTFEVEVGDERKLPEFDIKS